MKRLPLVLALALIGCTDDPTGPSLPYQGYSLVSINGQFLPARDGETSADAVIISASLVFDPTARPRGGAPGMVTYTRWLRKTDQSVEQATIQLGYSVTGAEVRIDLCPSLALCITTTELVGHLEGRDLELTHYLGGVPVTVYRFTAALPE